MRPPYIAIVSPWFLDRISWVIRIGNITAWPVIVSRDPMSDADKEHEEVHVVQQLELAVFAAVLVAIWLIIQSPPAWAWLLLLWCFVPFIGPYFIIYGLLWLIGLAKYRDSVDAYYKHPMEVEAYEHASPTYLEERPPFAWVRS